MKPYFLILFLWFCLVFSGISQNVNSELKATKGSFTTNILDPFSIGLELKVGNKSSIYFSPKFISYNFFGKTSIFSFNSEYRYYISNKNALNGFYIGPYLKFRHRVDIEEDHFFSGHNASADFFGGGAIAGYQKIFAKGFVLNFFMGPGYTFILNEKVNKGDKDYWKGINQFDIRLGAAIGFAF